MLQPSEAPAVSYTYAIASSAAAAAGPVVRSSLRRSAVTSSLTSELCVYHMSHGKMPIVDAKASEAADGRLEKWKNACDRQEREKTKTKRTAVSE